MMNYEQILADLSLIIGALEHSQPTMSHYPETKQRHVSALARAKHMAEHIAEHIAAQPAASTVPECGLCGDFEPCNGLCHNVMPDGKPITHWYFTSLTKAFFERFVDTMNSPVVKSPKEFLHCMQSKAKEAAALSCISISELPSTASITEGEPRQRTPLPFETAPKDGTIVKLFVQFVKHPPGKEDVYNGAGSFEDDSGPCWTIGSNSKDNTGVNLWQFVGWNWEQDCFVDTSTDDGHQVLGWAPF